MGARDGGAARCTKRQVVTQLRGRSNDSRSTTTGLSANVDNAACRNTNGSGATSTGAGTFATSVPERYAPFSIESHPSFGQGCLGTQSDEQRGITPMTASSQCCVPANHAVNSTSERSRDRQDMRRRDTVITPRELSSATQSCASHARPRILFDAGVNIGRHRRSRRLDRVRRIQSKVLSEPTTSAREAPRFGSSRCTRGNAR